MVPMVINRWIDLLDRVAWTFIQTFAATMVVLGVNDWGQDLGVAAIAGLFAALKTIAAQRVGSSSLGDAVPGASVIKT